MAVKGSATVTLSQYRDTDSVTRYYKLQSSSLAAPDKPANVKLNETPAGWSKSEPACDITKTLYTCDVTVFSDKTTHVSDVSKSTSYEAAKEAWNKANNAQGTADNAQSSANKAQNTADKAQSSADKAQNTANEAAKTADNFISTDSTGIMVSENKGTTKETPSNATKNNVLITEKDVQIRNGKKVVASYGETIVLGAEGEQRLEITENGVVAKNGQNTLAKFTSNGMQIGDMSGNNMEIKDNKVSIRSGAKETLAIESATTSHSVTTTYVFHGSEADPAMTAGEIYTESHILSNPVKINSVEITDESGRAKAYGGFYDVSIDGSQLVITIDASNSGANNTDWTEYTKCIVTYESGTVESTVKCNNIEASGTNGNMISYTKITSGTGKVKNTKGAVTAIAWSTCGCVATVRATFKATEAVAAGTDMCTGTFTGIPKPVLGARGAGAYSKNPMIFGIGENGGYFARNCGAGSIASGKTAQGILVYMTDGTFISATGAQLGGGV